MATIIFDFDGTLADSFEVIVSIFQQLTGRKGDLTEAQIKRLRHVPAIRLAKELGITMLKVPFLMARGRQIRTRHMEQVPTFEGMPEAIKKLAADNHQLLILSSNSSHNVRRFLGNNGLGEYFSHIYGGVGITGKTRALKRISRRLRLNLATTIYVGDETRDIDASDKVNIKCIAVSWGFNDAELLELHRPTAMVDQPSQLPATVHRLLQ